MLRQIAPISTLLSGNSLMMVGTALLGIAVPLEMRAAGLSSSMIGLAMSAFFAGQMLGALRGRTLIQRVGHIRVFSALSALFAGTAMIYHLAGVEPAVWIAMRLIQGFCFAGIVATMESWLSERATQQNRGQLFGIYMVVGAVAVIAGQFLVNLEGSAASATYMVAALAVALSIVPIALTRTPAPRIDDLEMLSVRLLYRVSPTGMVGAAVSGLLIGSFSGLGPVYAAEIGLSTLQISAFMASAVLGAALAQFPVGRLSDTHDRRIVLLGVLATVTISTAALAWLVAPSGSLALVLLAGGAIGAGINTVYPIAAAQTLDHVSRPRYVAAMSGLLAAYSAGAIAGPLVAAVVLELAGSAGLPLMLTTIAVAFGAFTGHRMIARNPVPDSRQEPVQPAHSLYTPATTEFDLYPATDPDPATEAEPLDPRDTGGYPDGGEAADVAGTPTSKAA
ncbi:MFS transporter [Rhodovibrio sodomensis]|nr:MFS transporter [Rhodovibrio sodomensis]